MKTHESDAQVRHRFFRAMVLMGSSLAAGCGGTATMNEGSGGSGGGGGGNGGSGGHGAGGAGGAAGAGGGGSGGAGGSGGGFVMDAGIGAVGGSFPVDGGPMPCVPAQWDCASAQVDCAYDGVGWQLPQGCVCDAARPRSAADCSANETFTCREGTSAGSTPLANDVLFECSCVPSPETCLEACMAAFQDPSRDYSNCESVGGSGTRSVLCGCALVYLR
jgi:hypothetical protein